MFKLFFKKAFSLIEVLMVITVIGILSSIVLLLIWEPIEKARDSRIINAISQINNFAEFIHFDENSYETLCDDPDLNTEHSLYGDQLDSIATEINESGGLNLNCYTDVNEYCVYSNLNISTNQWFCIDSTGKAGVVTTDPSATCDSAIPSYSCP